MSSIGNITARGRSGTTYNFDLYPLGTAFKALPGVYVILQTTNPIYVGQTGDLSERFDNHHKASEIARYRADRIGVLVERSAERRLAIEQDLRSAYNWPANG